MNKSLCTLVATMGKEKYQIQELISNMNLRGDVIVCNQTDFESYEEVNSLNVNARVFYSKTRGLSFSRNISLMNSNSDYCIIADDDLSYSTNYDSVIINEFERTQADVLIFALPKDKRNSLVDIKVNYLNYKKYGSVRIAFRRESIVENEIFFPLSFGSGSKYTSGEDTIFVQQCLKKKLKIVKVPTCVINYLDTDTGNSTWFTGYNNKLYFDKGALYKRLSKRFSIITAAIFAWRKSRKAESISFLEASKEMRNGAKAYQRNQMSYHEYYGKQGGVTND